MVVRASLDPALHTHGGGRMDRVATPPADFRTRATDTLCRATGAELCMDATLLWNAPTRIRTGGHTGDAGGDHCNHRLVCTRQCVSGMDDGALLRMGVLCNGAQLGDLETELNPLALSPQRALADSPMRSRPPVTGVMAWPHSVAQQAHPPHCSTPAPHAWHRLQQAKQSTRR